MIMKAITKDLFTHYLEKHIDNVAEHVDFTANFARAFTPEGYLSTEDFLAKQKEIEDFCLNNLPDGVNEFKFEPQKSPWSILTYKVTDDYLALTTYNLSSVRVDCGEVVYSYKSLTSHILFYESLDVVFRHKGHYKPVRLGFRGLGQTGLALSPFELLPLFDVVNDFEISKFLEFPTTLTYGDLLRAKVDNLSKEDILIKHLKNTVKVAPYVDFEKFSITEGYFLIKMFTELDPHAFRRFVSWFEMTGRYLNPRTSFKLRHVRTKFVRYFLQDYIEFKPDSSHGHEYRIMEIAMSYFYICRDRRRLFRLDFKTEEELVARFEKLNRSYMKKLFRSSSDLKEPFTITKAFEPLVKAIRRHDDNPFTYLSNGERLLTESIKITPDGDCLATDYGRAQEGMAVYMTVNLDNCPYMVCVTVSEKNDIPYAYNLDYMRTDGHAVTNDDHKTFVLNFLDNIL